MYIRRVDLKNIRSFDRLSFNFERPNGDLSGWTVITGDNSSGKTTFLKAIALALVGPDTSRSLQPSWKGWIREKNDKASIAVEIVAGDQDRFLRGRRYQKPFWSELRFKSSAGAEVTLEAGRELKRGKGLGPKHGPWGNPEGWFSAGYGPFRRLYGASSTAQRVMSSPGRVARFVTMFLEDATLGECELWLKELHFKKLEHHERESSILQQVFDLLDNDFLRNGLRVERVDSEGLWLRDSNNIILPLSEMSEGYRAALALLVDILRHMTDVYGYHELVKKQDGKIYVPHPGVVLIDEMDSHLHPEWQRSIGFWLKERFPQIQFIVTTHSPMICQAADENGLFHLPSPGSNVPPFQLPSEDYKKIINSKPDAILVSPAFGMAYTRSPRAVSSMRKMAQLRAKGHAGHLSHEEKAELESLQYQFSFPDVEDEG
ncbi:MAG: AAA family ATPase [Pirellulales bacterium]|nr:AAA family ATPase [Pirellulales bacterium]